ncbi:MAG TPA: universal stress protein [Candidatus Dormibacteraeota bacterium]|nr:universal stress protein [Candidatus Dormibacteraeota bacterium]
MKNTGFRRILVATDGSEQADAAGRVAISFARASSAEIRVVHVWSLEPLIRNGMWDVETRREAEALITRTVKWMRAYGVEADGELIRADRKRVASAVAESARSFGADLVVVGSRGLSDWQSLVKHSISHHLLTALDCPVLVVRDSGGVPRDAERVLLAVAGGDDVVPGVRAAIAAASGRGSKVLILHVPQAIFGAQGFAYIESDDEVQATLSKATALLREAGIPTEALATGSGHVADVVAAAAARWKADVIVIGSARMGDVASILLGSVTHSLLRATETPVLVAERIAQ